MVMSSLSERCGAGPGRFKACWITADPFIVSSTMVKRVVRTIALSSMCSALLVCFVYKQKRTTFLTSCLPLAQTVGGFVQYNSVLSVTDCIRESANCCTKLLKKPCKTKNIGIIEQVCIGAKASLFIQPLAS